MLFLKFDLLLKVWGLCYCLYICLDTCVAEGSTKILNRKKRYLAFPDRSTLSLTVSLLKGIASDIVVGPTVKVVTIHELDVLFPLPHDPSPYELAQTSLGQTPVYLGSQASSRHRRDLYQQLQDLFYMQGYEGRSCLMKALCEAKDLPKVQEENIILELMSSIFSIPSNLTKDVESQYKIDERGCFKYKKHCPFSIFDLVFQWAEQFFNIYNAK